MTQNHPPETSGLASGMTEMGQTLPISCHFMNGPFRA
jgi:hypothetical protein